MLIVLSFFFAAISARLILPGVVGPPSTIFGASECESYNGQGPMQGQEACDADPACSWCTSAAAGNNCYTKEDASSLPPAVFNCGQTSLKAPNQCESHNSDNECEADPDCAWCTSQAAGNNCYSKDDAKTLPAAVFNCSSKTTSLEDDDDCSKHEGHGFMNKDACLADDNCTWCTSGATGSGCYNKDDAKSLPATIFSCDEAYTTSLEDDDECNAHNGHGFKNKDACDADDKCTWCTSGAVGSSCYSKDDAKTLPAAIFSCDEIQKLGFQTCGVYKAQGQAACDADSNCTWCSSAAAGDNCYSKDDAASLPAAVFACDTALKATGNCGAYKAKGQAACDADSDCTWCSSAAAGDNCYNKDDAASLPAAVFACDDAKLKSDACGAYKAQGQAACDADSNCTWCSSAAAGDNCYAKDDAASLPSAVFACD